MPKLQQTQSFHDLDGTQKVLSQTLVSALQADRDAFDAIAAQQDNIRRLTLLESEATRLHTTSEARTTRRLVIESSTQASERSDANHKETRELVSSQTNDIIAHIVQSRQELEAHIDDTAQIQARQLQRDIAQNQVDSQIVLESHVRKLQEDAASELDIANFVTDWQIKSITEDANESLGSQLSRTQLELRDLQLAQIRQRIEQSCNANHASLESKKETPVGATAGTADAGQSTASEATTSYETRVLGTNTSRKGPEASSLEPFSNTATSTEPQIPPTQLSTDIRTSFRAVRRGLSSATDQSDRDRAHVQSWLPSEGIDLTVLAAYLKDYIDDTATIRQSQKSTIRRSSGLYNQCSGHDWHTWTSRHNS